MGVAQLVRADSEALRTLIEERTDVQVDTIRETVDWRMAAFAERMDEKLGSVAGDVISAPASQSRSKPRRRSQSVTADPKASSSTSAALT